MRLHLSRFSCWPWRRELWDGHGAGTVMHLGYDSGPTQSPRERQGLGPPALRDWPVNNHGNSKENSELLKGRLPRWHLDCNLVGLWAEDPAKPRLDWPWQRLWDRKWVWFLSHRWGPAKAALKELLELRAHGREYEPGPFCGGLAVPGTGGHAVGSEVQQFAWTQSG